MIDEIVWTDVSRRLRVGHYADEDIKAGMKERAYIYDTQEGHILWWLSDRGWIRETMHLNGHHYRTSKGRIYRRED